MPFPAPLRVLWEPMEGPQTALLECPIFEVFYGGARGGGKTEGSLGDWLQHQHLYGAGAIGKFFRKKRTQLSEVIARSKELYDPLGAKYNENKFEWKFPNGARLGFGFLEKDSDADEYLGHNYTRVYVEEATQFPSPTPINKLRATLRSARGVPVGMRLTGNPGGAGHAWVKRRYIDPDRRGYKIITQNETLTIDGQEFPVSISRVFIPSKVTDNRLVLLHQPNYLMQLHTSGSPQLVKAWLEGNWDIVDGAYFSEFEEGLHVLRASDWLPYIPRDALRFRAMDWGTAKPFSVGWYALADGNWGLPAGALLKYREWYGASAPDVGLKLHSGAIADGIKSREQGERIRYGRIDPSTFNHVNGPSIAQDFAKHGVSWWRGDNKRAAGWNQIRYRLRPGPSVEPLLYFLDTCEDTIRTLPSLQHDETNSEDLDTDGEDHAADELRYACMSRPLLTNKAEDLIPASPNGMPRFNDLLRESKARRMLNQESRYGKA